MSAPAYAPLAAGPATNRHATAAATQQRSPAAAANARHLPWRKADRDYSRASDQNGRGPFRVRVRLIERVQQGGDRVDLRSTEIDLSKAASSRCNQIFVFH